MEKVTEWIIPSRIGNLVSTLNLRGKPLNKASMGKRNISGFLIYSKERRPKLKEKEPGLSLGEIAGKLGREWKALSRAQREPYEAKARAKKQVGKKSA
jgi:hypothetical protein